MNKQQLLTAGSVLLATTSLAGVAHAGIITSRAGFDGGAALGGTTFSGVQIANTIFSTTASTANAVTVGYTAIYVAFSNNFAATTRFSIELDPINAGFTTTGLDARIILGGGGSFLSAVGGALVTVAAQGNCSQITPLTTKIILDGCGGGTGISQTNGLNANTSATYAGIEFSGVSFNNASGLASVGATVGVSALVYNFTNPAQNFENISAATVLTAASPTVTTVTAASSTTVNASATPVSFAYFTGTTNIVTMTLAYVSITGTGTYAADLASKVVAEGPDAITQGISSIQVTVTSTALSQAGAVNVSVTNATANVNFNATVANFSAGVATFSIDKTGGFTSFSIQVSFSGTAAIGAASAGTVTVAHAQGSNMGQAVPSVTGKTGSITLGGFQAELNTFLSSTNSAFSSFARIHNNGIIAAVATVTVRNDATGVTMGTYTTSSIATNQTLQISAKDIETGAGITPAAGVNYTLTIGGAFSGYAQHIIFNPATGQLADLSAFRNKGNSGGATSP